MSPSERRLRAALARNVRRQREAAGMTLEDFAERAGMHWRHVQKIEAGEVNVTLRTLARLGEALQVSGADLLA